MEPGAYLNIIVYLFADIFAAEDPPWGNAAKSGLYILIYFMYFFLARIRS